MPLVLVFEVLGTIIEEMITNILSKGKIFTTNIFNQVLY